MLAALGRNISTYISIREGNFVKDKEKVKRESMEKGLILCYCWGWMMEHM